MEGKRYNLGKSKLALLPFEALREVGNVLTYGSKKYDINNWRRGMKWSEVQDSLLRHYERFASGEDYDPETGLLHTAQLACNALFLLSYQLLGVGKDDRWKVSYNPSDLEAIKNKSFDELNPDKNDSEEKPSIMGEFKVEIFGEKE